MITNKNIDNLNIDNLISQLGHDAIDFEGMPRMIFDNEQRNQKINWIKLVNNMLSFT